MRCARPGSAAPAHLGATDDVGPGDDQPMPSFGDTALEHELSALTAARVLSEDQAAGLWQAAERDRAQPGPTTPLAVLPRTSPVGLLDVLGHVGAALLLGAVAVVASTLWDGLTRDQRIGAAVASLVVPLAAGLVLELRHLRTGLARPLLAVACGAAGFASHTVVDDTDLVLSSAVVVATSLTGAGILRSVAFHLPGWVAAMSLVVALCNQQGDLLGVDELTFWFAGGYLAVGLVFGIGGLFFGRHFAGPFSGLSGWAAALMLVADGHAYLAAALATAAAVALFVGVVRLQLYAFGIVGCLMILSVWPLSLSLVLSSETGVALGLVAAGSVLIAVAVLFARVRRRPVAGTTA